MLIDSYPVEDVFARVPEVATQTDPVSKRSILGSEDDQLYQAVLTDLGKRYQHTLVHGRHSTPVEVILRLLQGPRTCTVGAMKRPVSAWRTAWCYAGSVACTSRPCQVISHPYSVDPYPAPGNPARAERPRGPAYSSGQVTEGRKLRLDATCVQTEIHHPTDSGLLVDSVRVLSRVAQRAKGLLKEQMSNIQQLCRSRLRTARRTAQTLHRGLRRKGEDKEAEQKKRYEKLVETTEQMVKQVMSVLSKETPESATCLVHQAEQMLPLVERVIAQTRKRVLENKKVPSSEKVLSLFEPHTRAIPRHKGGALVEFGRLVTLGRASREGW